MNLEWTSAPTSTCYNYPGVGYGTPDQVVASFGQPSVAGSLTAWRWVGETSQVFDLCSSSQSARLGTWNIVPEALGGWTLSSHHVLDVPNKTVYRGNGEIQRVYDLNRYVVNVVAGGGSGNPVDGAPATAFALSSGGGIFGWTRWIRLLLRAGVQFLHRANHSGRDLPPHSRESTDGSKRLFRRGASGAPGGHEQPERARLSGRTEPWRRWELAR